MARRTKAGQNLGELGSMMGIGVQLVVTILAFAALGWWLDKQFDSSPWFLLGGLVFGATGGMISFIRTAIRAGSTSTVKKEPNPVEHHDLNQATPADESTGEDFRTE